MTSEEIKKDWEVIEAATPGPWFFEEYLHSDNDEHMWYFIQENKTGDGRDVVAQTERDKGALELPNARFISLSRTRWPEALREVERLTQRQLGLEKSLNHLEEFMRRELLEEPDPAYLRVHLDNLIDKFHHAIEHVKIDHVE